MFARQNKRPSIAVNKLSSFIAEGVEFTGDLQFVDGMRIDGHVKGNVIGRSRDGKTHALLVLSEKGRIDGNITCGDAVINGAVTGDLDIEHLLELQPKARTSGAIRYAHLQMDVGASVRGRLHRADAATAANTVVEMTKPVAAQR